jgi:hypothetical protein
MIELEKAYIAGFLDGEGCICLCRVTGRTQWGTSLSFTNTNLTILQWIQSHYGGGRIVPTKVRSIKHAQGYNLNWVHKPSIKRILEDLLPYLRVKKPQAENMLAFISLPPLRKELVYGRHGCPWDFSQEDIQRKDQLVALQHELNRKGKKDESGLHYN